MAFEYLIEKVRAVGKRRRTLLAASTSGPQEASESPGSPKVIAAVMMPPTTFLQKDRDESTVVTWTAGEEPIVEHSGIREEIFVLRGTSAYTARLGTDRKGQDLFAIGPELFLELDAFFSEFQTEAHKEELDTGRQQTTLIFHALSEEQDVRVEPVKWKWFRDVDRERHTYGWELILRRVGPASSRKLSELEQIAESSRAVARSIDTVSATLAKGTEYLGEINETLDSFREPLRSVLRVLDQIDLVVGEAKRIADFPVLIYRDAFHVAQAATNSIFGAWDALGPAARDFARPAYIETMSFIADIRRQTLGVLGRSGDDIGNPTELTNSALRITELATLSEVPVVERKLGFGQTLADLAGEVLGDRSRWIEIAELNGWHSATEDADGKPIKPGTVVLVPSTSGDGAKVGQTSDQYGTDFRMVDGDLVPAGDDPTDWQVISGPGNFAQGLTLRLKSVQGVSPAFPEFGLPDLVGRQNTLLRLGMTVAHTRTQLLLDPRVDSLSKVQVIDGGDRYTIEAEVVATDGRRLIVATPV